MKPLQSLPIYFCLLSAVFIFSPLLWAQQSAPVLGPEALSQEVKRLKLQVKVLDERISVLSSRSKPQPPTNSNVGTGGLAILFGAYCALWAQNTKRNPWLWFFVGAIFNVVAVLLLLYKNSTS